MTTRSRPGSVPAGAIPAAVLTEHEELVKAGWKPGAPTLRQAEENVARRAAQPAAGPEPAQERPTGHQRAATAPQQQERSWTRHEVIAAHSAGLLPAWRARELLGDRSGEPAWLVVLVAFLRWVVKYVDGRAQRRSARVRPARPGPKRETRQAAREAHPWDTWLAARGDTR